MASPHTGGVHGFSQQSLERKIQNLNSSMQNIQLVAQWAIHHRKHAKTITGVWYKELHKSDSNKVLTLLYLANDIVQNSRKKGPEFRTEFSRFLPKAFHVVSKLKDEGMMKSVQRIINIWEERSVFDVDTLTRVKASLVASSNSDSRRSKSESDIKHSSSIVRPVKERSLSSDTPSTDETPPSDRPPPDPDVLLHRMLAVDGDNSATVDMATMEKIAGFPPEIKNHKLLADIKDKPAAEELNQKLAEAEEVLAEYIRRLEEEEKERKDLRELLDVFIWQQRQLLRETKRKHKHYEAKLEKVAGVKEELDLKLARLPDLSKLPTSSHGSLAPLPSVGDLFN